MTGLDPEQEVRKALDDLHASYLKGNEYDEGDPIFYRITYRLEEKFGLTREEAARLHRKYHEEHPRRVSEGFCENCNRVVGIIPVIYGIQESDMANMKKAEAEGRLIIGDMKSVSEGRKVAMFGCKVCRGMLPKYGML
ncbi:MAG: hypothetical protein QXJ74_03930 [Nitrososphaera sp.]